MKKLPDWKLPVAIGAIVGLIFLNVTLGLALKRSHANERSLSQRIDVLMKEKASKP